MHNNRNINFPFRDLAQGLTSNDDLDQKLTQSFLNDSNEAPQVSLLFNENTATQRSRELSAQSNMFLSFESRRNRVEKQTKFSLVVDPFPKGKRRLHIPRRHIGNSKNYSADDDVFGPDDLELSAVAVCAKGFDNFTSSYHRAMDIADMRAPSHERDARLPAGWTPGCAREKEILASATSPSQLAPGVGDESLLSEENVRALPAGHPLRGYPVRICRGTCVERERKRAIRCKQPDDEKPKAKRDREHWMSLLGERMVVINNKEFEPWQNPSNEGILKGSFPAPFHKMMNYNSAKMVDLYLKLNCYSRHSWGSIRVIFTLRDYNGNVVAQCCSPDLDVQDPETSSTNATRRHRRPGSAHHSRIRITADGPGVESFREHCGRWYDDIPRFGRKPIAFQYQSSLQEQEHLYGRIEPTPISIPATMIDAGELQDPHQFSPGLEGFANDIGRIPPQFGSESRSQIVPPAFTASNPRTNHMDPLQQFGPLPQEFSRFDHVLEMRGTQQVFSSTPMDPAPLPSWSYQHPVQYSPMPSATQDQFPIDISAVSGFGSDELGTYVPSPEEILASDMESLHHYNSRFPQQF